MRPVRWIILALSSSLLMACQTPAPTHSIVSASGSVIATGSGHDHGDSGNGPANNDTRYSNTPSHPATAQANAADHAKPKPQANTSVAHNHPNPTPPPAAHTVTAANNASPPANQTPTPAPSSAQPSPNGQPPTPSDNHTAAAAIAAPQPPTFQPSAINPPNANTPSASIPFTVPPIGASANPSTITLPLSPPSAASVPSQPIGPRLSLNLPPESAPAPTAKPLTFSLDSSTTPIPQPQTRQEALDLLAHTPSSHVAIWFRGQSEPLILLRDAAPARIQTAEDRRIIVMPLPGDAATQWQSTLQRTTAALRAAQWLAQPITLPADRTKSQAETDRLAREALHRAIFGALLGDPPATQPAR